MRVEPGNTDFDELDGKKRAFPPKFDAHAYVDFFLGFVGEGRNITASI